MTPPDPVPSAASPPLMERKRRQVRQRIVEAADELFSARGFDDVSVTDIAERAEVGRTTFFRYFGDKTEVVFAKEQGMLDAIAAAGEEESVAGPARTTRDALDQLRPVVLDLCRRATDDADAYARRARLLEQHLDLQAREAHKAQQVATTLSDLLQRRGTDEAVAVLAAQVALACYQTGRRRARTAGELVAQTAAAFEETLALGNG